MNDRNDRIVNWWTVIRDNPDEFGRRLDWTAQHSRTEFERSVDLLDCEDPIRRAVALTVVISAGVMHCDVKSHMQFAVRYKKRYPAWGTDHVLRLHARLRGVQIENCDGCDLLDRTANQDHALIYVDPPYRFFGPTTVSVRSELGPPNGLSQETNRSSRYQRIRVRMESFGLAIVQSQISGPQIQQQYSGEYGP